MTAESFPDPRVFIRPGAPESEFHLDNLTIQRVFFEARNAYFAGLGIDDLWRRPVTPSMRTMTISFDASVPTTAPLTCTTRVVERTNRSFVMEQTLSVTGTELVVARCRAVQVTVSKHETGAVAVPDELWAAIATLESRELD